MAGNDPMAPPSLDLPPELVSLMNMSAPGINPMAAPQGPDVNDQVFNPTFAPAQPGTGPVLSAFGQPGYAQGGMVGAGGMPQQPMPQQQLGPQPQQQMAPPSVTEADIDMSIQQNPQAAQQIAAEVQALGINPQQLQMAAQLALVAMNNPEMYPQMRQFAIQQGLVDAEDIPEQYDPGFLTTIIIASRAMGGGQQMAQPMENMPNFADGGYVGPGDNGASGGPVKGPGTGTSDSVPIRVSSGEYIIPANVVQMKGREFFDKMLENYRDGKKSSN